MAYLPFGEVLFEEHSSSFSSPNLFNGKELDRETNMTYYSARYLDMKTSLWLNGDRYSENDLSVGSYVYSFNNPINFIDPDGNWPDLPSWKDVKKSYNEAKKSTSNYIAHQREKVKGDLKNIKRELYNGKGWDDTVKDVDKIGNNIQKWTKDNKQELLNIATVLKKSGDATATAGLVGAAAGAPFAGVGATRGLALATVGGYVSTGGSVLEIIVKLVTNDEEVGKDIKTFVAGKVVDVALPGPNPDVSQEVEGAIQVANKAIGSLVDKKVESAIKGK